MRRRMMSMLAFVGVTVAVGCAASSDDPRVELDPGPRGTGGTGGGAEAGGAGGGFDMPDSPDTPTTCADAAATRSYIGCDFYPTVTPNGVWELFDYAVAVANSGDEPAEVIVRRGGTEVAAVTLAPGAVETVYLPWVEALKGEENSPQGGVTPMTASARVEDGAYHLVSSRPVTVYQFNALEYRGQGGPPGKDWSACPSLGGGCFSFSNDASLLLPTTALSNGYRVTSIASGDTLSTFVAITATQDGTLVTVDSQSVIDAGPGVDATEAGGQLTLSLDAGDVALLNVPPGNDASGSYVESDRPVQVISGAQCLNVPGGVPACDHLEESVFPAETLGKRYIVTRPTGPSGTPARHVVRLYGNFDGTTLSYPGGAPPGAPESLEAGEVVDLSVINSDFEVSGSQPFAVSSYLLGAVMSDPGGVQGDPSQSQVPSVAQFRKSYVFHAPTDYAANYLDVIMPVEAQVTVDGYAIFPDLTLPGGDFGVARVLLPDQTGAHRLASDLPVGIQVSGYGDYTSYAFSGGLNLTALAPPR